MKYFATWIFGAAIGGLSVVAFLAPAAIDSPVPQPLDAGPGVQIKVVEAAPDDAKRRGVDDQVVCKYLGVPIVGTDFTEDAQGQVRVAETTAGGQKALLRTG